MRKWIARKLFDTAIWLDWDEAVIIAEAMSITRFTIALNALTAPRKAGRPKGSKDKKPRKPRVQS